MGQNSWITKINTAKLNNHNNQFKGLRIDLTLIPSYGALILIFKMSLSVCVVVVFGFLFQYNQIFLANWSK